MHRIDTSTAQVDKFGSGKNGFTGGNPQTGVLPTALDADYFDSIQEELAGVIESSGITLSKSNNSQLLAAIKALVGSGRLLNVQVKTASGTYIPTTGTKSAIAEVQGAGGGGQGAGSVRCVGGGGGAGAYVKALITSLSASYPITIGTGGAGTVATAAGQLSNSGGSTTFGSFITCGGGGGGVSDITPAATTGSSCIAPGGQAGVVTTSAVSGVRYIIVQNGSRGSFGTAVHPNYLGGNGGVSNLGSGGKGGATAPADSTFNSSGYGAGGGGNSSVTTAASGGNGGDGVVIIWEFA